MANEVAIDTKCGQIAARTRDGESGPELCVFFRLADGHELLLSTYADIEGQNFIGEEHFIPPRGEENYDKPSSDYMEFRDLPYDVVQKFIESEHPVKGAKT